MDAHGNPFGDSLGEEDLIHRLVSIGFKQFGTGPLEARHKHREGSTILCAWEA